MREVWDKPHHHFLRVADCDACGDTGEILLPVLAWGGRILIGHGAECRCRACVELSSDLKAWLNRGVLEGRIRGLPPEALLALSRREIVPLDELRYCPLCAWGARQREVYREGQRAPRDKFGQRPAILLRVPEAERIDPESPVGQALLAEHRDASAAQVDRREIRRRLGALLRAMAIPDAEIVNPRYEVARKELPPWPSAD